jgi:hypothetical protein
MISLPQLDTYIYITYVVNMNPAVFLSNDFDTNMSRVQREIIILSPECSIAGIRIEHSKYTCLRSLLKYRYVMQFTLVSQLSWR